MRLMVRFIGRIQFTIALMLMLFLLILFASFAQVDYGIFEANRRYFSSWFVWFKSTPIFLGGYSIGLLLVLNLLASHATKLKFTRQYMGIFLIHFGLVLLIIGSAVTSFFGQEMQISITEGQEKNHVEFPSIFELVLVDTSKEDTDQIHILNLSPQTPLISFQSAQIKLISSYTNAILNPRGIDSLKYEQLGEEYKLISLPKTYKMSERNIPGMAIEVMDGNVAKRYILWGGSSVYQSVVINQKSYLIKLRPKRQYLAFSIFLDTFTKQDYPGTSTPKRFISDIQLKTASGSVPFVIQMNQPLRYNGYTFFQSSFTEDLQTSVFQVVKNPSWVMPYFSSLLIVMGLLMQMIFSMKRKS